MRFIIDLTDYDSGKDEPLGVDDIEEAVMNRMDQRGDDGVCEVEKVDE